MMKKILLTHALILSLFTTQAQKWALQVGSAYLDYTYLYKQQDQYKLMQSKPALHARLNYQVMEKISVGISGDMSLSETAMVGTGNDRHYLASALYGILIGADYHYLVTPKWDLSSGYAMGYGMAVSQWKYLEPPAEPLYYASGYGWNFNVLTAAYYPVKHIGIYANIGYGYSGVAGIGVTGRF